MESSGSDGDYHQWLISIFLIVVQQAPGVAIVIALLALMVLIVISGLISGSEVAYFSISQKEFNRLRELKDKPSAMIIDLLNKPRYLLATILITNNFVNVAIVIVSYYIFSNTLDLSAYPILGFLINVLGVTFFLVVFGEVLPKVYATKYNLRLAFLMSIPLLVLRSLFKPFSYLLVSSTRIIERRLTKRSNGEFNPDELEQVIDLTAGEKSTPEEVKMLKGIVKFGNTMAKQIMRSRVDVVAIDENTKYLDLLDIIKEAGYSRIPVYKENLDNIIGIIYVKDLLEHLDERNEFNWHELLRTPIFTPETKKIDDLLKEIQDSRVHFVVVVDEYGGTSGIITLEDILEEVIGDIQDEYDTLSELEYEKIDSNIYIFEGKTSLKDICKVLNLKDDIFDKARGDADSLAGLILEVAGKFPAKNEEFSFNNFSFKVISLGENRVTKVKITIKDDVFTQ